MANNIRGSRKWARCLGKWIGCKVKLDPAGGRDRCAKCQNDYDSWWGRANDLIEFNRKTIAEYNQLKKQGETYETKGKHVKG